MSAHLIRLTIISCQENPPLATSAGNITSLHRKNLHGLRKMKVTLRLWSSSVSCCVADNKRLCLPALPSPSVSPPLAGSLQAALAGGLINGEQRATQRWNPEYIYLLVAGSSSSPLQAARVASICATQSGAAVRNKSKASSDKHAAGKRFRVGLISVQFRGEF